MSKRRAGSCLPLTVVVTLAGACLPSADPTCGDGHVDTGEECDEGSQNDDLGRCTTHCKAARHGDGFVQQSLQEACDDGNDRDDDDCLSTGALATCGDGFVHDDEDVEECDDGNTSDTDGCTQTCRKAFCGDGFVEDDVEECDDGNDENEDSCTTECARAVCGDGIVQQGEEECDDGKVLDIGECTSQCAIARCGDGLVRVGVEQCDDGNGEDGDGCLSNCTLPVCGDGIVSTGEECDDGNTYSGDFCNEECNKECLSNVWGDSGQCYFFIAGPATGTEARAGCAAFGQGTGHLVAIDSQAENDLVRAMASSDVWIGLNDSLVESAFTWDLPGDVIQFPNYTNWSAGEPNNGPISINDPLNAGADCVLLSVTDGHWRDSQCLESAALVCEYEWPE